MAVNMTPPGRVDKIEPAHPSAVGGAHREFEILFAGDIR